MQRIKLFSKLYYSHFLFKAEEQAKLATCERAKCGAVIVKNYKVIGRGFNSPPGDSEHLCHVDKKTLHEKVTDKTCCAHAERRAMDNALSDFNKEILKGSMMFFSRLDDEGHMIFSGNPYCTRCSKDALDLKISKWVLRHKSGIYVYGAEEYHELSRNYKG